jgi:Xaa-Pro dipeptidase
MSDIRRARQPELPEFPAEEFEGRVERAQRLMGNHHLDALLITSEANMEYLAGFVTEFAWNTPTRPWYFLLSRSGVAVGIIPELGVSNWRATSWVKSLRTWPSPRPENEGLDLLATAIKDVNRRHGRIGVEIGPESRLGMPVVDLRRLQESLRAVELVDGMPVLRELRLIKSEAEIARIRRICQIASDVFEALPEFFAFGDSERELVRKFRAEMLLRGADKTPYAAIGSGHGGYESIITGPTERRIREGDLFLIDTGSRYGGYFCDFDRNYAVGSPPEGAKRVHEALFRATEAGIDAARPGNRAEDVFRAQAAILEHEGVTFGRVGRMGHGLGKLMTEPPSNRPGDHTVLAPGMVLTIEPSALYGAGKMLVHEENLVVTSDTAQLLTRRAPREISVLGN